MSDEEYQDLEKQVVDATTQAKRDIQWLFNINPLFFMYQNGYIEGHTQATLYALRQMREQHRELTKSLNEMYESLGE